MLVSKNKKYGTFLGEDGERMTLRSQHFESPDGGEVIEFSLECGDHYFRTLLDRSEVAKMHEFLKLSYGNSESGPVSFSGEHGERLIFRHSNMGEPYRDGVDIRVEGVVDFPVYLGPFVESSETRRVRDFIIQ